MVLGTALFIWLMRPGRSRHRGHGRHPEPAAPRGLARRPHADCRRRVHLVGAQPPARLARQVHRDLPGRVRRDRFGLGGRGHLLAGRSLAPHHARRPTCPTSRISPRRCRPAPRRRFRARPPHRRSRCRRSRPTRARPRRPRQLGVRDAPPVRAAFIAARPFPLDPFQVRALDALDAGRSVLVAAPTGSGKTLVAEYAIAIALASGTKTFYTTPLKALSNQKYGDLVREHGAGQVGLLTGDNAINGDAPIVVMTTEVLRNMIYANSPTLRRTALRGARRSALPPGPLPRCGVGGGHHPPPASRSTSSRCRPRCRTPKRSRRGCRRCGARPQSVIEERRPVELEHLYLVGDRSSRPIAPPADVRDPKATS